MAKNPVQFAAPFILSAARLSNLLFQSRDRADLGLELGCGSSAWSAMIPVVRSAVGHGNAEYTPVGFELIGSRRRTVQI